MNPYRNPRIDRAPAALGARPAATANVGSVRIDPLKLIWVSAMLAGSLLALFHATWGAVALFVVSTLLTLLLGHSVGMHRRFIHRAFGCPRWLELALVHLGVLVGLNGPIGMLRTHDLRDWAQRQNDCHPFFAQHAPWWRDLLWQLFCRLDLARPPRVELEPEVATDRAMHWLQRTWMLQQLPWALLFFLLGGLPWVLWGICVRISVSVIGHWFIGYLAHNRGAQSWLVEGAAVQGYNVRCTSLLTMGECWHNNHHAFPGSAKLGLEPGQWDPGWWLLQGLERVGLVWDLVTPAQLPARRELRRLVTRYHPTATLEPLWGAEQ